MIANFGWMFVTGAGVLILGFAMAYALVRQRRLTTRERALQARKTHELYGREEPKEPSLKSRETENHTER